VPLEELSCGGVVRGTTSGRVNNYVWDPYGSGSGYGTSNSLAPPGIPQWGQYSGDKFIRFTAAADADYMFDCCNSTFDTYLHVLTDDGNYSRVASGDDTGNCGLQTQLSMRLQAGASYLLVVEGYWFS